MGLKTTSLHIFILTSWVHKAITYTSYTSCASCIRSSMYCKWI